MYAVAAPVKPASKARRSGAMIMRIAMKTATPMTTTMTMNTGTDISTSTAPIICITAPAPRTPMRPA